MSNFPEILAAARILPELTDCLGAEQRAYLVGGAVRDVLLKRPATDFDFATAFDPTPLARQFAQKIGGHWFMLDPERRQSRVVLRRPIGQLSFDFAPFRGAGLDEDLRLRDFTVNAMSVAFDRSGVGALHDPLGGVEALAAGLLRCCSEAVFYDDPLRVLRGVRLAAALGMDIESDTFSRMETAADALSRVSAERLRSELVQIFAVDTPARALTQLSQLKVLPLLLDADLDQESFCRGLAHLEQVSQRLPKYFVLLDEFVGAAELGEGMSALAGLHLVAFFAGCGTLQRQPQLFKKLRFSKHNEQVLLSLSSLNSGQAENLPEPDLSERGRALWAARLGPAPIMSLVYLLCLGESPPSALERARAVASAYQKHRRHGRIADLVNGTWIAAELGITDGHRIGELLEKLRLAEIDGRVTTPQQAHKFLKLLTEKTIDKQKDPP